MCISGCGLAARGAAQLVAAIRAQVNAPLEAANRRRFSKGVWVCISGCGLAAWGAAQQVAAIQAQKTAQLEAANNRRRPSRHAVTRNARAPFPPLLPGHSTSTPSLCLVQPPA